MDFERFEKMGNDIERIPYIAHESALARNERTIKRLIIALVLSIVLMFASNGIWLYAWMQYDYSSDMTTTEVNQKSDGANVYGDGNEINEPTDKNNSEKTQKTQEKGR